jgi:hypothetical protein
MDNLFLSNSFEELSIENCTDINGGGLSLLIMGLAVVATVVIGGALLLGVPMFMAPTLTSTL